MNGTERRNQIIVIIKNSHTPVSGSLLAKQLNVSRQVIVQDIALLRSSGYAIISTNRGYIIQNKDNLKYRVYKVSHSDDEIEKELQTIIDLGGMVVDVFVSHRAYGLIRAELNIRSRRDITLFIDNLKTGISTPLKNITNNFHYHTISADSDDTLELIFDALNKKGFIVDIDDWDWQYVNPKKGE